MLLFGVPDVDQRLPGGGLAFGSLHEVAGGGRVIDGAAAALFWAGIAARTKGKVLWCMTRPDLFAPALSHAGHHPDRVIYVEADREEDVLASFEEGLRYGDLSSLANAMVCSRSLMAVGTSLLGGIAGLQEWEKAGLTRQRHPRTRSAHRYAEGKEPKFSVGRYKKYTNFRQLSGGPSPVPSSTFV